MNISGLEETKDGANTSLLGFDTSMLGLAPDFKNNASMNLSLDIKGDKPTVQVPT